MGARELTAKTRHAMGRMRPVVAAGQMLHRKELEPAKRRYRDLGVSKPWFASVRHSEVAGRGEGEARLDVGDGIEQLESDPRFAALEPSLQEGLRAWPDRGYLVAESFFDRETVAELNAEVDAMAGKGSIREHHLDPRYMNVHRQSPIADRVATDPRIYDLLELILGRPASLFQTIYFRTGSQQEAHSDAFHMMTEPPGFLVGGWIALEDIDEGQGPVYYLPGSHRLPYVMTEDLDFAEPAPMMIADKGHAYVNKMRAVIGESGLDEVQFTAGAGDLLLWHHNLIHGGSAVTRSDATRRSLVGHYFAEDVLCYHEVTERAALMPAGFA